VDAVVLKVVDVFSEQPAQVLFVERDHVIEQLTPTTSHPTHRPAEKKPSPEATVVSSPRLGGLHHRYCWREAA
jgi:hypothetical protein